MLTDRYGNDVSTPSQEACDAYIHAVDLFLAAQAGVAEAFQAAIEADEGLALAYLGLAREYQSRGMRSHIPAPLGKARICVVGGTDREISQVHALGLLLEGKTVEARAAILEHLALYPRDAMVAQACMGVFGLIGFSGLPGREADQLAFTTGLERHYGDDWWFLSQHAFAQLEVGQFARAEDSIERALAINPTSANSAHIRSHLYYENGEAAQGLGYLDGWRKDYARGGILHCHVSWHVALWALQAGDIDNMWAVVDADIDPDSGAGPPLNVMTDMVALLFRAGLAGVEVPKSKWQALSDYAFQHFPRPGLAFADTHAAVAHAMAGDQAAVARIVEGASGPAAGLVSHLAKGFGAMARGDWDEGLDALQTALPDQARIGGSNAQRDMINYGYAACLGQTGRAEEARRFLSIARPNADAEAAVAALV